MGMVQIRTIAEIVPKSLFLYNCMQTKALSSLAFVPVQNLSNIRCEHCLSDSPEMGYFREQSNSENIQKSNTLTIFYFGILHHTLYLPFLPSTFCMKDAQYLISVRKLTINFLVAWEQGAAGCS